MGATVAVCLVGTACSGDQAEAPTQQLATTGMAAIPDPQPNASTIAEFLRNRLSTITNVVTITEDNDPNNLIGRPNGYVDAAVVYDATTACPDLGTDCGATIEVWPTPDAAQQRANYIADLQRTNPILGTEYHHLRGRVLLRVAGSIKPSLDAKYSTAFHESAI
ncbi:hypothetical protein ACFVH4_10190 [Nocardia ignorata]|uniref:hypothetical protein n=1 Tax=Nocardia ignorata TaxID=145285 RepID=UPI003640628E